MTKSVEPRAVPSPQTESRRVLLERTLFNGSTLIPPLPSDLVAFEFRRTQLAFRKLNAATLMNTIHDSLQNNYGCDVSHDVDCDAFRGYCSGVSIGGYKSGQVCGLSAVIQNSSEIDERCSFDVICHYLKDKYCRTALEDSEEENHGEIIKPMLPVSDCEGYTLVLNWHLKHGSRDLFRQVFRDFQEALAVWYSGSYRPKLTCDNGFMATRSAQKPRNPSRFKRSKQPINRADHLWSSEHNTHSSSESAPNPSSSPLNRIGEHARDYSNEIESENPKRTLDNLTEKSEEARKIWESLETTDIFENMGASFLKQRTAKNEPHSFCTWEDSLAIYVLTAVRDEDGHVTNHLSYATQLWENLCGLPTGSVNHGECRFQEIKSCVGGRTSVDKEVCSQMGKPLFLSNVSQSISLEEGGVQVGESNESEFGSRRTMMTATVTAEGTDGGSSREFKYDPRPFTDLLSDIMHPSRRAVQFCITKQDAPFDIATKAVEIITTDKAVVSICVATALDAFPSTESQVSFGSKDYWESSSSGGSLGSGSRNNTGRSPGTQNPVRMC